MSQENKAVAEAIVEPKKVWKDRIPTLIAITTLILAVCATLSSFKAGGYSTKMILSQSQASDQWAYYQAKSIKETAYQTQRDALELARQSYPQLESAYCCLHWLPSVKITFTGMAALLQAQAELRHLFTHWQWRHKGRICEWQESAMK